AGSRPADAPLLGEVRRQDHRDRALRADRANVRSRPGRRRRDGVSPLRLLQCGRWSRMGREHDVGGLSHGTVSRHRLEHPHRGPHRDRAVADPDRGRAAAGAPTAVQLAAGALVAAPRRLPRALLLTAHLGNWELLAAAHRLTGFPLSIVVRPLDAPWLDALAEKLRRSAGVELIAKRGALRPVLEALRRGRMIGILMDQNAARREGVFVDFFGRPASTSRSIALLAVRTRTPVVPVFARRDADGRHRVVIHPALPLPEANGAEAAVV